MSGKYAKIEDVAGMVRDMDTRAIISTDKPALDAYRLRRSQNEQMKQAIDDINMLKNELSEIKSLLVSALDKRA